MHDYARYNCEHLNDGRRRDEEQFQEHNRGPIYHTEAFLDLKIQGRFSDERTGCARPDDEGDADA